MDTSPKPEPKRARARKPNTRTVAEKLPWGPPVWLKWDVVGGHGGVDERKISFFMGAASTKEALDDVVTRAVGRINSAS